VNIAYALPPASHIGLPPGVLVGREKNMTAALAGVESADAHDLLRRAYDASYRWPAGFSGFRAKLRWILDDDSGTGTVELRSPHDIDLQLGGLTPMGEWLQEEFAAMASHWWPAPYDETYGRFAATLGQEKSNPFGSLISLQDDPVSSSFRVRDGQFCEMNHRMESTRLSIHILQRRSMPDGKTVPSQFKVTYRDTLLGRLTHVDTYCDTLTDINGIYLLSSRSVVVSTDEGSFSWRLVLRHHELLTSHESGPDAVDRGGLVQVGSAA
jgi:hypothetical protein